MSQAFTYIDVAGNQARYTIEDKDRYNEYRWSTDHGDSGAAPTYEEAQYAARNFLKDSMSANRRSDESSHTQRYASRWR